MAIHAYHPETQASLMVEEGALAHMRASGWMKFSEHEANQAAAAEAAQAAEQAAATPAPKSAKSA